MKKIINILLIVCSLNFVNCSGEDSATPSTSFDGSNSGKGGSTARFTTLGNYLYTVDEYNLNVFKITSEGEAILKNTVYIGFDIETIFPRGADKLFIGSSSGMYIYDVENPELPKYLSIFRHVVSCDPVVADKNYAYVTLRSNDNWCGNNVNQLDILDVRDLSNPIHLETYQLTAPYGLGIQNDTLYVCDNGLKVFDVSNKKAIRTINHFKNIDARDVITNGKYLIMTSTTGIYQYSTENNTIKQISVL